MDNRLYERWSKIARKQKELRLEVYRQYKNNGMTVWEIAEMYNIPETKVKRFVGTATTEDWNEEWNRVCRMFD